MSAQRIENFVTPEQYLAIERAADFKSEYFAGEMVAMSGASDAHELIVINLGREVSLALRGRPCSARGSNLRVRVPGANYLYPDVSVICGEVQLEEGQHNDTLLNPTAIFEILSDSTEYKDRGIKWRLYQRVESLQHYVLIDQHAARVEIFTRQGGDWLVHSEEGLDKTMTLPAIDVRVKLSELYENVKFPTPPSADVSL